MNPEFEARIGKAWAYMEKRSRDYLTLEDINNVAIIFSGGDYRRERIDHNDLLRAALCKWVSAANGNEWTPEALYWWFYALLPFDYPITEATGKLLIKWRERAN